MSKNNQIDGKLIGRLEAPKQLRVEAWRAGERRSEPYAVAEVGDNGRFSLPLPTAKEKALIPGDALTFRVFADERQVADTARSYLWYFAQENPPLEIEVRVPEGGTPDAPPGGEKPPQEEKQPQIVIGRVLDPEGQPVTNAEARLVQRTVTGEKPIAKTTVRDNGRYDIKIEPSDRSRDFIVRVWRKKKLLGESDPCVEMGQQVEIDVVVGDEPYRGPAEYDRLLQMLEPHLDGADLADVDRDGIEFLECKTGIAAGAIGRAVRAAQLAKGSSFHPAILYGMFRVGLPGDTRRLLRQEPRLIRQAAERAIDQHLISQTRRPELAKLESSFVDLAANAYVNPELAPDNGRAHRLLNLVGLKEAQQRDIIARRLTHKGSIDAYWQLLREADDIGAETVAHIKLANQLDQISGHHAPLTESLFAITQKDKLGAQTLARWSQNEWMEQLAKTGVPQSTPGRTVKIKQQTYSEGIMRLLETAYPTTALGARLAETALPQGRKIGAFTAENPDFEFRHQRVDSYLKENNVTVDDETMQALKSVERLAKITPDSHKASYVAPLLNDNLDSAHRIQQIGQGEFLRRYSSVMGQAEANSIYQAATFSAGLAQQLFMGYGPPAQSVTLSMVADPAAQMQAELPEWTQLFGSLDTCSCEHCESVYSPAAYLVDILEFLNDRGALAALEAKRPDIGETKLNCENANTLLPYIDLVNEILEQAVVANGSLDPTAVFPHQTTLAADTLRVQPEHLQQAAYDVLRGETAVYPFNLPFDLWQSEADTYLAHLDVARHKLMHTFSGDPATRQVEIAAAQLGIATPTQLKYIADARANFKLAWGYPDGFRERTMYDELANVDFLLQKSHISYEELLLLLAQPVINVNGNLEILFAESAPCDLAQAEIQNVNRNILNRIHSFLRLRLVLGWTIPELGRAIDVLNGNVINEDLIVKTAHFETIRTQLGHTITEMLTLWGSIDTRSYDGEVSQYDDLFLNRSVTNDAAIEAVFGLNADRSELTDTSAALTAHSGHIIAALGIAEDELTQLIDVLGLADQLTLVNLSALYRHVLLADGLDLTISDYLILWQLYGGKLFDTADLGQLVDFVETAVLLDNDGMDLGEIDYLLNHSAPNGDYAPGSSDIVAALEAIRSELYSQSEAESAQLAPERLQEIVIQQLATVFDLPLDTMTLLMADPALDPVGNEALSSAFLAIAPDLSDPSAPEPPEITEANYGDLFDQYRYLDKLVTVLYHFGFTAVADAAWLLANGAAHNWLDLTDQTTLLLQTRTHPLTAVFRRWVAMVEMATLRASFPETEPTLLTLLEHVANGDQDQFVADLLKRTGWQEPYLQFLVGKLGYTFPGSYANGALIDVLTHLAGCFDLIDQLGVSAEKLWAWANATPSFDQALDIKQTVRAKYDAETWLKVAEPLRDALREQQRDALVGHMVQMTPDVADENDLFGYLLIDVEMAACMQTSRIKQALSSVQLFIQRCFLNLEPAVQFDAGDAAQWEWMHRYRVWEANRKIFLYPENWIEPELRGDKTPIFEEVEAFLLQDEITPARAEEALRLYLEELDRVAALDVVGLYHELDGEMNVLHIIGRTPATPHAYYYRQLINETQWTPWEEVEVEIEGDHVLPVIYNRRLYLFWLTIAEKEPKEVKLAWSQFWNGKWAPKSVSNEAVTHGDAQQNSNFRLRAIDQDGKLTIECIYVALWGHSDYVKIGTFIFDGCSAAPKVKNSWGEGQLILPKTTDADNQHFAGLPLAWFTSDWLEVPVGTSTRTAVVAHGSESYLTLLRSFEDDFFLQPSNQFTQFLSQAPYAFWDNRHRFLVLPSPGMLPVVLPTPPQEEVPPDDDPTPIDPPGGFLPPVLDFPYPIEIDDLLLDTLEMESMVPDNWGGNGDDGIGRFSLTRSARVQTASTAGEKRSAAPVAGHFQMSTAPSMTINGSYQVQPWQNATLWGTAVPQARLNEYNEMHRLSEFVQGCYHRFITFYHPYSCLFQEELARVGIDGVLNPPIANPSAGLTNDAEKLLRQKVSMDGDAFANAYDPHPTNVKEPHPIFDITFNHTDAYAQYNWELFFHLPFFIANHLNQNQQFAEAQKWYHYIFDPTNTDSVKIASGAGSATTLDPARYWKIRPFYENDAGLTIQNMMILLAENEDPATANTVGEEVSALIEMWRNEPFDPHTIARFRTAAYQKAVVLKYIDNLIDWGDSLFAQDTIESINEATQLYLLAGAILGKRPRTLPQDSERDRTINNQVVETYNDLKDHLDDFANALVEVENLVTFTYPAIGNTTVPAGLGKSLFFCIPANDNMLTYWDTVADRLYKIRNCMNIEGVVRSLALFEPPIDPAMLVKAAAAGLDLGTVLSDLALPLPHYRFSYMVQKAAQFCSDVQALGNALQAALEKQDAEELALLRAGHEKQILKAVKAVKQQQIEEAQAALDALLASKASAEYRRDYYANIEKRIPGEKTQLKKIDKTRNPQRGAVISQSIGAIAALTPTFTASLPPEASFGGVHLSGFANAVGGWYQFKSSMLTTDAQLAGINAGYRRRAEEWKHQETVAGHEIAQLEKQIAAAEIRLAIAEQDLANHEQQIANAEAVETVMKDKFTNEALYSWMVSQVSSIYFQSYQMAYDLAKKVQKAFQHELGNYSASYISFGYWDSLRKGLLAGEMLLHDLRRMENAYIDENQREMELTKHISLAQLDPAALLDLRTMGHCFIDLPEGIFDLDYPGHYMRRIKSVSLTIPGISGPYTTINCTLTLNSNRIRIDSQATTDDYEWEGDVNDGRFQYDLLANQSIATSSGVNDSGLFELNFRDERYLPFEGAGVISNWKLDLGQPRFAQFDFKTISDVVFHINYTARRDDALRTTVESRLETAINTMLRASGEMVQLISLRSLFPDEWAQLLAADETADFVMALDLTKAHFPYFVAQHDIAINDVTLRLADLTIVGTWSAPAELSDALGTATFTIPAATVGVVGTEIIDLALLATYEVTLKA